MARCDSYTFGNCTAGACALAPWIPDWLGDGGDWAGSWRRLGGQVIYQPQPGTVVSYCRGDGYSQFGHCGYVEQVASTGLFLVREMNYVEFDAYDERWSNMQDVCGFLVPPGGLTGSGSSQGGPSGAGGLDDVRAAWDQLAGWWNQDSDSMAQALQQVHDLLNGI